MNSLDNQKQTIKFVIDELYTTEVAKVIRFYPENSTADVTLLLKRVYADGTVDKAPTRLSGVPVRYPQMGNFVMYAPLVVDDVVFVHFARMDWDNWLLNVSNTALVEEDGTAKHTHNCPYIEVGARNYKNPSSIEKHRDKFHMAQGEAQLQLLTMDDKMGLTLSSGKTEIRISPTGEIIIKGDVTVEGDVTANGVSLFKHVHDVLDIHTGGPTLHPTNPPTPQPTK
jgi:hypothetical protein